MRKQFYIAPASLFILSLVTLASLSTQGAQPRSRLPAEADDVGSPNDMQIYPVDPGLDTSPFEAAGYTVHHPGSNSDPEVPAPKVRDRLYQEIGLESAIAGFDPLDRDLLYLRAKDRPFSELRSLYPSLPASPLKKLQQIVQGRRR